MTRAVLIAVLLATASPSLAQISTPNQGFYSGLSMLYPYKPVYCDNDNGLSACYGSPGELMSLPKSAPLPPSERWCQWAAPPDDRGSVALGSGWEAKTGGGWYQWEPRVVAVDRQKYLGERVCYFDDRGSPKNINDLKRDPAP